VEVHDKKVMAMFHILCLLLLVGDFVDEKTFAGRSTVTFLPITWSTPSPPLAGSSAKQGTLTLGAEGQKLRMLWDAKQGTLEIDKAVFKPTTAAQEIPVTVDGQPRTLLLRLRNDEPVFAVRGYATGTVEIEGKARKYLLTDGNADGIFNTAGRDRLLIDLDGDGTLDALAEQFLVGESIRIGEHRYLVVPNAKGTELTVRKRPTEQGKVTFQLPLQGDGKITKINLELLSEWGEFTALADISQARELPVGKYRVSIVEFDVEVNKAETWSYRFYNEKLAHDIIVEAAKPNTYELLPELKMRGYLAGDKSAKPGELAWVQPIIAAKNGLTLSQIDNTSRDVFRRGIQIEAALLEPGSVKKDSNFGCLH
jgi:hypothetical protein